MMLGVSIVVTMYAMGADQWACELGECVVEYGVLLALGILFRLQGEADYSARYTKLGDENEGEVQMTDIEADVQEQVSPTVPMMLQTPDGTQTITPVVQRYDA